MLCVRIGNKTQRYAYILDAAWTKVRTSNVLGTAVFLFDNRQGNFSLAGAAFKTMSCVPGTALMRHLCESAPTVQYKLTLSMIACQRFLEANGVYTAVAIYR